MSNWFDFFNKHPYIEVLVNDKTIAVNAHVPKLKVWLFKMFQSNDKEPIIQEKHGLSVDDIRRAEDFYDRLECNQMAYVIVRTPDVNDYMKTLQAFYHEWFSGDLPLQILNQTIAFSVNNIDSFLPVYQETIPYNTMTMIYDHQGSKIMYGPKVIYDREHTLFDDFKVLSDLSGLLIEPLVWGYFLKKMEDQYTLLKHVIIDHFQSLFIQTFDITFTLFSSLHKVESFEKMIELLNDVIIQEMIDIWDLSFDTAAKRYMEWEDETE